MLFKQKVLDSIAKGDVTVAFRKWKRPTVRAGGRLRTAIGELAILAMDRIDEALISERDATAAGFENREKLLKVLKKQNEGHLYRIRFRLEGPDTRIALRENSRLSVDELRITIQRLGALDKQSGHGEWTARVLQAIRNHPEKPAAELSAELGLEKEWLKTHIRKLKNLGLTISLSPGYRLSPRGKFVLGVLERRRKK
jgi:hypothetical protein